MKPGFEMKSIWLQNWPLTMMLEVFQFGEGYCWRLLNSSNVPEHIWSLDNPQWRILFLGNGLTHWLPLGVKEWCKISFGINELILGEALGCIKIFQYFFFFLLQKQKQTFKMWIIKSKLSVFNSDAVTPISYMYKCVCDFIHTKDYQIHPLHNFAFYIMSNAFQTYFLWYIDY